MIQSIHTKIRARTCNKHTHRCLGTLLEAYPSAPPVALTLEGCGLVLAALLRLLATALGASGDVDAGIAVSVKVRATSLLFLFCLPYSIRI